MSVLDALRTADSAAATALTAALVRMQSAAAHAALFEALTLPSVTARKAAARALAEIGSGEDLAALSHAAAKDPDRRTRKKWPAHAVTSNVSASTLSRVAARRAHERAARITDDTGLTGVSQEV